MQASRFAKSVLKTLPLVVLMLVAGTGILLARDLHPRNPDFQTTTDPQLQDPLNNPDLKILSAPTRPCVGPQIYTSLPPKCRASDGTLTQINPSATNTINIPEIK